MSPSPLQRAQAKNKTYRTHRHARVLEAKKSSAKEPFDIKRFGTMYDLSNDHSEQIISTERINALEEEYYLTCPECQTLEAFAHYRRRLDAEGAG